MCPFIRKYMTDLYTHFIPVMMTYLKPHPVIGTEFFTYVKYIPLWTYKHIHRMTPKTSRHLLPTWYSICWKQRFVIFFDVALRETLLWWNDVFSAGSEALSAEFCHQGLLFADMGYKPRSFITNKWSAEYKQHTKHRQSFSEISSKIMESWSIDTVKGRAANTCFILGRDVISPHWHSNLAGLPKSAKSIRHWPGLARGKVRQGL